MPRVSKDVKWGRGEIITKLYKVHIMNALKGGYGIQLSLTPKINSGQ